MREMVPFRKHLGTDKDLRLLPGKRLKDLLHAPRAASAVPIQAQNPASRRQKRPDILFDTLGSLPHGMEMQPFAARARRRERNRIPAIVADQPLSPLVVGQTDITMRASGHLPTVDAVHQRSITAPIQENHRLIPLLHRLLECGERLRSQNGLDAVHGPDVHQPDRRQRTATHTRRKRGHRDFRLADRVKRLQIRGRGSEHQ